MELLPSSIALLLAPILVFSLKQPPWFMGVAAQQTNNQLTASGIPMSPTTRRLMSSADGTFAFGFCNYDPSSSLQSPQLFLLAIWFDFNKASNCTNKAVVWFARDENNNPVIAKMSSFLSLDDVKGLSLMDGPSNLWSPGRPFGSTLQLLETGNLQLVDAGGAVKWQSFDDPTHVLLPGQTLTNQNGKFLVSKISDTDFSVGWFKLIVQDDCNIVLYMRDPSDGPEVVTGVSGEGSPYWASGTWHQPPDNCTSPTVILDDSGTLYYYISSKENLTAISPAENSSSVSSSSSSSYYYAALDPDGTVRVYHLSKKNTPEQWAVTSQFPPGDGCSRKTNFGLQGICGPNSYCTVSPDQDQRRLISCSCATPYHEYIDTQHQYKGCRPSFLPDSCDGQDHSTEFTTTKVDGYVVWGNQSTYKKYQLTSQTNWQQCNASCLNDCFCMAVLINDVDSSCMFMGMLTEGRLISSGGDTASMTALVKIPLLPMPGIPAVTAGRQMSLSGIWLYSTIGVLVAVSVASGSYILWHQCYASHKQRAVRSISFSGGGLRGFTYKELYQATNGFKVILGRGGFGEVCKGELSSLYPPHVAVKRLIIRSKDDGDKDFENEVQSIGQIHHKNLVRMIGYCKQRVHRMLVFEYMQGGTLASVIFGSQTRPCWSILANAAVGIAKGLEYLHEGCKSVIVHCDIKPDNILFNDKHVPKITDFGIARLLGDQTTQQIIVTNTVAGTRPYIAPEWFDGEGKVGSKVDVYSFGVVLLEIICCRRATSTGDQPPADAQAPTSTMFPLRARVESLVRGGNAELLVQGEPEAMADMESVERFARIAIWCLQRDPSTRPTMRKVVQMLEGDVEVDPLPDPPRPLSFSEILPNGTEMIHYSSS